MINTVPSHFSNKLELIYKKRQKFLTDRTSFKHLLPGIIFGFLLLLLGVYEWFDAFGSGGEELVPDKSAVTYKPLLSAGFFDLCFIAVGLGMVISNILLYFRYNKYSINTSKVTIIKRPIFRKKYTINEPLKNYSGIRFRVEFLQSGFLLQNLYIIELYHKNPEKVVPLYLSTSDKGVRQKWKEYAKQFKLPAMINTDSGLKTIDIKNLNKSVSSLYKMGLIEDHYDAYDRLPSAIEFVRKKDKMVLKIKKIVWDAYNLLAWAIIVTVLAAGLIFWIQLDVLRDPNTSTFYNVSAAAIVLILVAIQVLFRKEKLVLKKHKIVNTHKYILFSTKHNQIMKKDIESIEVTENPATGRYFVSIISEDNIITFGAKMSIKDLQWIKRFLIHEIVTS